MSGVEEKLGERVAAFRKAAELTQAELAEKVDVSTETISRLERGAAMPSLVSIEGLARALHVELPDLFRFREKETPKDRAVDRLFTIVRPHAAEDVEAVADVAERMFAWRAVALLTKPPVRRVVVPPSLPGSPPKLPKLPRRSDSPLKRPAVSPPLKPLPKGK